MKKILVFWSFVAGTLLFAGCGSKSCRMEDGILVTETPARAAGQRSVLGLRTEPLDTVRVGFIGLGMRGPGAVERFTHLEGVSIRALCDLYPERVDSAQAILTRRGLPAAAAYSGEEGWKELCRRADLDLVYICTPWQLHVPMAVYAMEQGKHVAVEVPAATSLEECWQLVNTAEQTQRHCMMLENCVYDFFELTTLNMARQGLFGEILHTEGAYIHNLEPFWDYYQGNWRLDLLPGELASRLQSETPGRRLRHARAGSGVPAARHPPWRPDALSGFDGYAVGQWIGDGPGEDGRGDICERRSDADADQDRTGPDDPSGT